LLSCERQGDEVKGQQASQKWKEVQGHPVFHFNFFLLIYLVLQDPNAPKRPKNAYMFFIQAHRADTVQEHPDMRVTEISKVLGQKWRELDASEKKPYNDQAAQDKLRYEEAMEEYKESQGSKSHNGGDDEEEQQEEENQEEEEDPASDE
jgi:hypothetical protein